MAASSRITRLRELIQRTHVHGMAVKAQLQALDKAGKAKSLKARLLRSEYRGLVAINRRRRRELAELEHKPGPAPAPKRRFTMYDTVTVSTHLPVVHPAAVAGYVGGKWPTYNGLKARYPQAKHLSIAVNANEDAECLDVETGDATPAECPAWFHRQKARGVAKPCFYANASTMPAVEAALHAAGIQRWQYRKWVAHYTHVPHIEDGADACQYTDVENAVSNYDASLCEPWFL